MKHSEAMIELATALAKANESFPPIQRNCTAKVRTKSGSEYSYDYADLNDILSAVRKPLAEQGLTISHDCIVRREVVEDDAGRKYPVLYVDTIAILRHSSGEFIESSPFAILCDGTMSPAQLVGSGSTYGKRYTTQNILGLSTEQDDDANTASGNDAEINKNQPVALPACPKCGKTESVIKGKANYGGGLLCFAKKNGCGHKWYTNEFPDPKAADNQEGTPANGHAEQPKADPPKVDGVLRTKTLPILESAAKEGVECFTTAFQALSKEARLSVQNDYQELRKLAEKVVRVDPATEAKLAEFAERMNPWPDVEALNEVFLPAFRKVPVGLYKERAWQFVLKGCEKNGQMWDGKSQFVMMKA